MSFTIYNGRIRLTEPDGQQFDYEQFLLTVNPDGTRTLRTLTRSPVGDLLRDVNQMVAADWRPIEAMGRLYFKNQAHGTVLRRVVGDKLHSYVWTQSSEIDHAVFDAPPNMLVGFHPIFHDAWKMCFVKTDQHAYQDILTHTVSNTWNGKSLGHGLKVAGKVKFEGREEVTVPAGTFLSERFTWQTSFGKELHVWRHGPDHLFVKIVVAKGDLAGSIYELSEVAIEQVRWP